MMSKMLTTSAVAALLVSGVAAEHHAATYIINEASAHADGYSDAAPGLAATATVTDTFAEGDLALAEAAASSRASSEDWWGYADAGSDSLSVTEIADGGILALVYAHDFADQYGDSYAYADADAYADGAVTIFKKYWEPEPEPEPEPAPEPTPEPCDGWWCHEDDSK